MKSIDDLAPKTAITLPVTLWQRFDDIRVVQKNMSFQLKLNGVILLLVLVATLLGWVYWWFFVIVVGCACPFYWFYKTQYQKMPLNNHSPLPVLVMDKHTISIYDNHGKLMAKKTINDYTKTKLSSDFYITSLSFCFTNKKYRYFLFVNKQCHYYLCVDSKEYAISWENLPLFVDSLVVEAKAASDNKAILFNKRYYINGY